MKKNPQYAWWTVLALVVSFHFASYAKDVHGVGELLSGGEGILRQLDYMSYSIEATPKGWTEPKLKLNWQEQGDKCSYTYWQLNKDGSIGFTSAYSFDGERSFRTFSDSGIFITAKKPVKFPSRLQNFEFITSPYEFVIRAAGNDFSKTPFIKILQSEEVWAKVLERSKFLGKASFKGKEYLAIQVDDCFYKFNLKEKTSYRVFFSLDENISAFVPVAWQQYTSDGRLISELEVVKSIRLKDKLFVPEEIKVSYYDTESKNSESPVVTNAWQFKFSGFSIENSGGHDFLMDPSNARIINDEDQDVWMAVPK